MNISSLLNTYTELFPEEKANLRLLREQLDQGHDTISRKNFVGHVTASGFVVHAPTKQVLLLQHKSLGKFLQPGGHIELEDTTPLDTAIREVSEESGLSDEQLELCAQLSVVKEVPFDIDVHYIPPNDKKNEPGHYYYDFRYCFTTFDDRVTINESETENYKWLGWEEFVHVSQFSKVSEKIQRLLEPSVQKFFRTVAPEKSNEITILAISHIIPSSLNYIQSLHANFNLLGIIPKPNSIDKSTRQALDAQQVPILYNLSREAINKDPDLLVEILEPYQNICLVDIGGYFSGILDYLEKKLKRKLIGVVEDTENGYQKYEQNFSGKVNVISVARSPLKDFEDQLVGHSVAHAAETLLRETNALITYRTCGVIGYGKVGRGIAEYLIQRGIKPLVCEENPIRSIQAVCDGAIASDLPKLLSESEVIFCATGNRVIDILQFRNLRTGAYLASVTSSDDEFDLDFVEVEYTKEDMTNHIARYTKHGHHFYLLNEGNAVNFLYAAAVDKFIYLVQAELIASTGWLYDLKGKKTKKIMSNEASLHEKIAKTWLRYS